jgi:formiminoglutamase
MELSCRGYMREPEVPSEPDNWPVPYDGAYAAPIRATLTNILETATAWARG